MRPSPAFLRLDPALVASSALNDELVRRALGRTVNRSPMPISRELAEHAFVSAIYALSRIALAALGLQFNFELRWMFLSDPTELRERLLETVLYFHAYPPGMNLITGVLLKLGGAHAELLARVLFWGSGLLLVNALLYVLRAGALGRVARCALSLLFCLAPTSLYFENLYLYETPVAALLCLAAALFHRATLQPSLLRWLAFFTSCAVIGWIRSTFHLIWFVAMLVLALWAAGAGGRRRVLLAALAPALLLLSLYLKNYLLFGVFGAASSGASNVAHVTVMRLPTQTRNTWIREGKLSRFSAISVYASPRAYLPYFESSESERWPQLNALDRPSVNAPNYNHWFFLEVGKERSADARYYLRQRPLDYARTVLKSLGQIFEPSTLWHPYDRRNHEEGAHYQHRQLLGPYESVYNRLVHGVPLSPQGVYIFLPLCMGWALLRAWSWRRAAAGASASATVENRARGALVYFCAFQILFVVLLSSAFTIGESSRYRFQIECMIWLIGAVCCADIFCRIRQLAASRRGGGWLSERPGSLIT